MKTVFLVTIVLLLLSESVLSRRRLVITDEEPTTKAPKKKMTTTLKPTTTTQRITKRTTISTIMTTIKSSQHASLTLDALKRSIVDIVKLRYRELYLAKIYCNYDLSEKQLHDYDTCHKREYKQSDWYKRCEKQVYGKKWTHEVKRYMRCNKPSELQKRWIECIRGERDRNRYEIVNQSGNKSNRNRYEIVHQTSDQNNNKNTNKHRRSKRSTAIYINLNSKEEWNKIPVETKQRIFEQIRRYYRRLKQEVECMENAFGINGN